MNKKGLSDIITTILIILLALAAIVLIWGFIRRPIEQGGQQIEKSSDCLALNLKPTACQLVNNNTAARVVVQWADGDVELQQIKAVITDGRGANIVANLSAPTKLGTSNATVSLSGLTVDSGLVLSSAGVVKTKSGVIGLCAESLDKIACA